MRVHIIMNFIYPKNWGTLKAPKTLWGSLKAPKTLWGGFRGAPEGPRRGPKRPSAKPKDLLKAFWGPRGRPEPQNRGELKYEF